MGTSWIVLCTAIATLLVSPPGLLHGQQEGRWEAVELEIERSRLQELLSELEEARTSDRGTAQDRSQANLHLDLVRRRLDEGDFRPGDRILLSVAGEPVLSDTFTVVTGPALPLPTVGQVGLHGVLRSEIEPHLREAIGRIVRDPTIRARALVQLSVLGEVENPGFYVVAPDALLSEALMHAGGPTREAKMEGLRIERGPGNPWNPEVRPDVRPESWSVNELGLLTGDRVIVPRTSGITTRDVVSFSLMGATLLVTLLTVF